MVEIEVDDSLCLGCSSCVQACPNGVLVIDEEKGIPVANHIEKCEACHTCESVCTQMAITVKE